MQRKFGLAVNPGGSRPPVMMVLQSNPSIHVCTIYSPLKFLLGGADEQCVYSAAADKTSPWSSFASKAARRFASSSMPAILSTLL